MTLLSVFPENIQIQHQVYVADGNTDSRGNPTGALASPVIRYVIGFYRSSASGTDPISLDYLARSITDIMMLCHQPTLYKKLDRVLAYNGADWLAYEVQDQPFSWAVGYPWQRYAKLFGGEVHIRRVQ